MIKGLTKSEYDKQRYEAHKEEILERHRAYNVDYKKNYIKTESGRVATRTNYLNMKAMHPDKLKARYALKDAIKAGKIIRQPCEVCGEIKVEAHHDDYSKPLEVRWLCHRHHCELEGRWKRCPLPDKDSKK